MHLPEMIALGIIVVSLGIRGRHWVRNRRKLVWPKNVIDMEPYLRKRISMGTVNRSSRQEVLKFNQSWHQTQ
mgnify:CR=1 FL=1